MLVKDLPEQTGLDIKPEIKKLFLQCVLCGSRYSANKGDYFMADENTEPLCCEEPLLLCRKEVHIIPV